MKTLVTGISGYVGAHVALALLKGNKHQVVGVVRDKAQQARLEKEDSFRFYVENGTLTFCIVADLCSESDALSSAMQGVECVHHLASPYHYTGKDAEQEYLRPAIDATMTVIKAATRASPPVSTFALLSSFAAVLSPGDAQYSGKVYTEEDWNCISYEMAKTPANPGLSYMGSKKYAELAAYEYQQLHAPDLRLVTLLPPVILGAAVGATLSDRVASSQSFRELFSFLEQGKKEQLSPTGVPVYADVREVGQAHVGAMENSSARGRYLVSNGQWDWQRLADACHDHLGLQQRGERGKYSNKTDESRALYNIDSAKSKAALGITGNDTFDDLMCGSVGMVQQALLWLKQHPTASTPSSLLPPYYLGSYLLDCLHRLNTGTIFGVPGDFNFGLCDLIDDDERFAWGGNATELGAAYAADGYSRTHNSGPGVVLTTWAVGELSAINGIMGAFAERVPIVHIVGLPPRPMALRKVPIHHSLANGDYQVYERIAKEAHCIVEVLTGDVEDDLGKIDAVLTAVMRERRPGYLGIPTDCVFLPVAREMIQSRMKMPFHVSSSTVSVSTKASLEKTLDCLFAALRPVLIYDAHISRKGFGEEARRTASLLPPHMRYFVSPLAKGVVDEDSEQFGGMFIGALSEAEVVRRLVEETDLIVRIGFLQLDTNGGAFSARFPEEQIIEVDENEVGPFLEALYRRLETDNGGSNGSLIGNKSKKGAKVKPNGTIKGSNGTISPPASSSLLSQSDFWSSLETFLRPGDVILAETGTASFGILDVALPPRTTVLTQLQFNSIGWSVGAALGACMSIRESSSPSEELSRRVVLLVGDGSLQMTVSELSTFVRNKLTPVILVLNNDGYTIERVFHAPRRTYNDIQPWNYGAVLKSFAVNDPVEVADARTKPQLDETLTSVKDGVLTLVDVKMSRTSAPRILQVARAGSTATNINNYAPPYRW